MSGAPIIRRALPGDVEAISALWRALDALHARLQPSFFRTPGPGGLRDAAGLHRMLHESSFAVFVAETDEMLVGALQAQLYDTPTAPSMQAFRRAHVDSLLVRPTHQRRGVGRALMGAAADWARRQGAVQLLLTVWRGNDAADAFYRDLGYRPINTVRGIDLE